MGVGCRIGVYLATDSCLTPCHITPGYVWSARSTFISKYQSELLVNRLIFPQ